MSWIVVGSATEIVNSVSPPAPSKLPAGQNWPSLRRLIVFGRWPSSAAGRRTLKPPGPVRRSEEHTSELQSRQYLVCRLLLEKKNRINCDSTCCQNPDHPPTTVGQSSAVTARATLLARRAAASRCCAHQLLRLPTLLLAPRPS